MHGRLENQKNVEISVNFIIIMKTSFVQHLAQWPPFFYWFLES